MPANEEGDQDLLEDFFLTYDDAAHLGDDVGVGFLESFNSCLQFNSIKRGSGGHWLLFLGGQSRGIGRSPGAASEF